MCLATLGRNKFSRKEHRNPAIEIVLATQSLEITARKDMESELTTKHSNLSCSCSPSPFDFLFILLKLELLGSGNLGEWVQPWGNDAESH